jgi:hypothetical protein
MTEEDEAFNEIERLSKVKQTLIVHKSKESMLIAEVSVLTEMVRVLSDKLAIEQNKQEQGEPVEWGVDWGKDGNSVSIIKRLADGGIEVLAWEYSPHPQQRTWVGLTDEEIDELWESTASYYNTHDFARAIEAKLKEKNG